MDSLGVDVSHKIRSAIKAKLLELGAYVDEELPDYIMVMVANKKTKSQMSDDLTLFLGSNTDKFTLWLHQVLERLQSVTSDTKKKPEPVKAKTPEKKQDPASDVRQEAAKETEPEVVDKARPATSLETKESDVEDNQEEVLAIKADFEADEMLAEELRDRASKADGERGRRQNVVTPMRRTMAERAEPPVKPSVVKPAASENANHGTKRTAPASLQPAPIKQRILSSAIQSMPLRSHHHHHHQHVDEEDVFKPRAKTLASIVKVSERRPSLPPTLQANKKLILKAMEEAKKSVIAAAQKVPAIKVEPYQPAIRPNAERGPRGKSKRAEERVEPDVPEEVEMMDLDRSDALTSSSDVTEKAPSVARKHVTTKDNSSPNGNRIVQDSRMEEENSNPEFIVTLDGIDLDVLSRKQKPSILRGVRSTDLDLMEDMIAPMAIDEEESSSLAVLRTLAQTANAKIKERCRYWPACKNGDICPFHHPSIQCKTFPRCKYGEKCLYIHPNCLFDAGCSRKDCPYTHASKRTLATHSAAPKSRASKNPKNVRCKYFPQCTKMDCAYFHPKACRYGLSCKQSGCVYGHPQLPSPEKLKWTSGHLDGEKNERMDQKRVPQMQN